MVLFQGELGGSNGTLQSTASSEAAPRPKENDHQKRHLEESDTYVNLVENARRYAFWLFALLFILFLSVYTAWIFTGSKYFEWEAPPRYNAIVDDTNPKNDTNRLFAFQEKEFPEDVVNSPDKETESEIRYSDIIDSVVKPRLGEEGDDE